MKYELIYVEQRKVTWVLIIVPLLWSAVFIGIILFYSRVPEWLVLISSILLLAVSLISVLTIIKKWLTIKCSVELTDAYFKFSLNKKTPFYFYQEIKVSWEQVNNFIIEDINKSFYVVMKLSIPIAKFTLSPASYSQKHFNEFRAFAVDAEQKVLNYNKNAHEKHLHLITSKSIFESIGARISAVVFVLLLSSLTFIYKFYQFDFSTIYNWWRIAWLWFISAPYLIVVFLNWKKKK